MNWQRFQSWQWIAGTSAGVVAAIGLVALIGSTVERVDRAPAPTEAHHQALDDILGSHLGWAEQQDAAGLAPRLTPVREFFDEARRGTRGFAEDVLGWESKFTLARDYFKDENTHEAFMEECFAARVFAPNQLERLVEMTVATYIRHLDDIDSQLLVRLQADLEGLSSDDLPLTVDRQAIQKNLAEAIQNAVHSVQADFRGSVGREIISFVTGEVLGMAVTQLATSTGILGAGAYTGTVTFGVGFVVGIIVDLVVNWAYEQLYDPAGEISRRLNDTLDELERLILDGDGKLPGLEGRLRDYAARRCQARTVSIQSVVLP